MVTSNEPTGNDRTWVDDRLSSLKTPDAPTPDLAEARKRFEMRAGRARARRRRYLSGVVAGAAVLAALPWPRAVAQELWERFTADRVEVVSVGSGDAAERLATTFAMTPQEYHEEAVGDLAEASRLSGFAVRLPPADITGGVPELSIIRSYTLTTRPLDVAEIRSALEAANVVDATVPDDWQGTTLVANGGPAVVARYDGLEITQAPPLVMAAPARVKFGQFMELAFRVFGRSAAEAKTLGETFQANPALVLHFPEQAPVRDLTLADGSRGIFVGEPDGSDGGICFFWTSGDRIFIVSADQLSHERAIRLAAATR